MSIITTSSAEDFDFLIGKWAIRNRKLKIRLQQNDEWEEFPATDDVTKILNGIGNIGQFHAGTFAGLTLRLFNLETQLWNIYWADNARGQLDTPVVGAFENKVGIFYGKEMLRGELMDVEFRWDATDPDNPVWSQAFSADGGVTWETNWYMYFSKLHS
ncbi:hypothetical protein GFS24_25220 [Chitinophaga sp. SYP-B3965]|uniref:hypothetical protein n=1 Tax=Chitinophaga sp. SYP-B3965 TaxID=2663120 RepID=UPI0012999863|nr:hypothetical protein [Chitinophaga sp. SYP-B3965]MRG48441.1 hypothetical protein [Chitinophaga sp. SYP-B3965]